MKTSKLISSKPHSQTLIFDQNEPKKNMEFAIRERCLTYFSLLDKNSEQDK